MKNDKKQSAKKTAKTLGGTPDYQRKNAKLILSVLAAFGGQVVEVLQ
jgi:hypothetical protein